MTIDSYAFLTTLCICGGIVGNVLNISVFTRHLTSINVLLSVLSATDLLLLILAVPTFVLPGFGGYFITSSYQAYVIVFIYPFNCITQTLSVYLILAITIERWTAVCKPLQVRYYCTAKTSQILIAIVMVWAVLYNVPRFFEYKFINNSYGNDTSFERNLRDVNVHPWYYLYYFTASYLMTHFVIPFSFLFFLNAHVIWLILKQKRERRNLTTQERKEIKTTCMLIVVTLMFACCNCSTFILNLLEYVRPNLFTDPNTATSAYYFNDVANFLVIFASSTNFFSYVIFSEKYRLILVDIVRFGFEKTKGQNYYNSTFSRTQSVRQSTNHNSTQNAQKQSVVTRQGPYLTVDDANTLQSPLNRTSSSRKGSFIKRKEPQRTSSLVGDARSDILQKLFSTPNKSSQSISHDTKANIITRKMASFSGLCKNTTNLVSSTPIINVTNPIVLVTEQNNSL